MSRAEVSARRSHAHAFLTAAGLVEEFGTDAGIQSTGNTIASLAVLAGIAAADATCGSVLGERAASENHAEAVEVLRRSTPDRSLAAHLRRLLDSKTESQYSTNVLTDARAEELMKAARRLVVGINEIIRGLP